MMRAILFVLALLAVVCGVALVTCTSGCASGSLVRTRCTHVGLRPAASLGEGAGATVQISGDPFVCREVYP